MSPTPTDGLYDSARLRQRLTRLYRAASWLLPPRLRAKHGEAMVELLSRELAHAASGGVWPIVRVGAAALADVLLRTPYEWTRFDRAVPDVAPTLGHHAAGGSLPPVRVRTLLRQAALPFLAAFGLLTGLLLAQFLLRQSADARLLEIAVLSIPFTAALTIPMATFLSMLWISRRRRLDAAMDAAMDAARHPVMHAVMHAVPTSLVRAVIVASSGVAVCTLALTSELVPRSNARLASVLAGHDVARSDRSMTIPELQAAARAARAPLPMATPATVKALREQQANYGVEIHKKLVLSASCIVLALAGLVIGWRLARAGLAWMGVASVAVFATCYVSIMAGESLADQLVLSPGIAMWAGTLLGLGVVAMSLRGATRGWRVVDAR